MQVSEAILSRFTCRAFLPTPVPRQDIETILNRASRSPSGGNLQPWRVWILAGAPLAFLQAEVKRRMGEGEFAELNRRAARYTLPYFEVVRAKMILMAANGMDNDQIAARLDTRREVVSQWRKRFFKERLAGLEERARPGRPRVFPPRAHG